MDRFFGGNPLSVLLRLVILSVVVGIVLATLQITPFELFGRLRMIITRISDMGFDAVRWGVQYLILGAMVVVPIWLLVRLFAILRRDRDGSRPS